MKHRVVLIYDNTKNNEKKVRFEVRRRRNLKPQFRF